LRQELRKRSLLRFKKNTQGKNFAAEDVPLDSLSVIEVTETAGTVSFSK
jgi:hypothetical protein